MSDGVKRGSEFDVVRQAERRDDTVEKGEGLRDIWPDKSPDVDWEPEAEYSPEDAPERDAVLEAAWLAEDAPDSSPDAAWEPEAEYPPDEVPVCDAVLKAPWLADSWLLADW